jgi:hypothetical protein
MDQKPTCKECGLTEPQCFYRFPNGRWSPLCRICDSVRIGEYYRKCKQQAVDYKGGKCERCGYNKCLGALDFHHSDPLKKDPNWHNSRRRPLEKRKDELDECQLLCRNCHSEAHEEQRLEWHEHRLSNPDTWRTDRKTSKRSSKRSSKIREFLDTPPVLAS